MEDNDPFKHERSHFSESFFERMGAVALSAAGFSAALVFFLAQTRDLQVAVSLWAALSALLFWLCAWQYVSPYVIHGQKTYRHFNFFLATVLSAGGFISLLVAVAAIVLQLSLCAGVLFSAFSVVCTIWSLWHNISVSNYCKSRDA